MHAPAAIPLQLGCPDSAQVKFDWLEMETRVENDPPIPGLRSGDQPYFPANPEFEPRKYQLEVFERAREQNTIIVMETGCGKTMIAVMLMHDLADRIQKPANKIAVFLAPTVPLVQQQAGVIQSSTTFRVGSYWGGVADDTWNLHYWEQELDKNEVFVMTPELLVTSLRHSFLRMDMVEILIFDECHHALKKTPYAAIMNEFYLNKPGRLPRIFGMTAVPIIGKGCTKGGCATKIDELEALLHAKVYTIRDNTELEHVNPSPVQSHRYYDSPYLAESVGVLQARFAELNQQYMMDLLAEETSGGDEAGDLKANMKQQKKLKKIFTTLGYCLFELGLWCTQKAAELLDKDDAELGEEAELEFEGKKAILRDIKILLKTAREKEDNAVEISHNDFSSKVHVLLDLLKEYRNADDLKCIVFVERVMAAKVLAALLSSSSDFSFLRCKSLTGSHSNVQSMSRQQQKALVDEFRGGKVNLLVATNIAEEGLDIQTCGLVIRFDLPPTLRSFIQSRGRARRLGSSYVLLVERGNSEAESCIRSLLHSENLVAEEAHGRGEISEPQLHEKTPDIETFRVESTGASVNTDCSVQLLHRYCSTLPGDKFYRPVPEFNISACPEGGVVCTLTLPPNAPFRHVIGHPCQTNVRAKQVACLEACKQLYACGALTDYLLLPSDLEDDEEAHFRFPEKNVAASNAAELYPRVVPTGLHGACVANGAPATLHAYQISLAPEPFDRDYAEFALFLEAALDNELGSMEAKLYLSRGRTVNVQLIPAGQVCLDQFQIHEAKVFQTNLLSTMLDPSGHQMAPIFVKGETIPMMEAWEPSLSYLVLPLLSTIQQDSPIRRENIQIDWLAVRKVVATRGINPKGFHESDKPVYKEMSNEVRTESEVLQVADGLALVEDIIDAMVLIQHEDHKAFYRVPEVIYGQNSNSVFNDPIAYATYAEYFQRRHGEILVHTQQPLLRAKSLISVHNLLPMRSTGNSAVPSKPERTVELPPELCKIRMLGFTGPIVNGVALLPSLIHRLESMLVANELRDILAAGIPDAARIPTMKILSSLTTGKCGETFSLESLELLGDAFLKFAVSLRLFLVYDKKHEGQLSVRRARAICNSTLHKLGVSRGLPGFIRDSAFCPKQWVVPGRWCRITCDANKMKEIHDLLNESEGTRDLQCSHGHRLMYHKTVADVVEALIGTHLVECGENGALDFMRWIGVIVDFDPVLKVQAQKRAELNAAHLNGLVVRLENKLNYRFRSKVLAIEAVTHASYHDPLGQCYQRLEFLGDAVLDFLITKYLYLTFPGLKPGLLTDLRSATVNNDAFARVAVQHCLHTCLLHNSKILMDQVKEFLSFLKLDPSETDVCHGWEGDKAPKVLGDLVESLAGAVFVDANFDLDKVWAVFEPLLQPFATLDTLRIHPVRELYELCQLNGFKLDYDNTIHGKLISVTATVVVKDSVFAAQAEKVDGKSAKRVAAQNALIQLQNLGYQHPRQLLLEALDSERNNEEKTGQRTESLVELGVKDKQTERQVHGLDMWTFPSQPDPISCMRRSKQTHDAAVISPEGENPRLLQTQRPLCSTLKFPSQQDSDQMLSYIRRSERMHDADAGSPERDSPRLSPKQYPLGSAPTLQSHKQPFSDKGTGSIALKFHEEQGREQDYSIQDLESVAPKIRILYNDGINALCRQSGDGQETGAEAEMGSLTREGTSMLESFRQQPCIPSMNKARRIEGSVLKCNRAESSQQVILESSLDIPVETAGSGCMPQLNFKNATEPGLPGRCNREEFKEAHIPGDFAPSLKMWSKLRAGNGKEPATSTGAVPMKTGLTNVPTESAAGSYASSGQHFFEEANFPGDYAPYLKMWSKLRAGNGKEPATSTGAVPMKTSWANVPTESAAGSHASSGQRFFQSTVANDPQIQCGEHRARLYEICAQKKWPRPRFLWLNGGEVGGTVRYKCDAQVEIPSVQTIHCTGLEFCNRRAAMDSAASVAIEWLTHKGFCYDVKRH